MKKMLLLIAVIFAFGLVGCSSSQNEEGTANSEKEKIQVVTTLFPQYDFTKQIAGDLVDVKLLLPPGVEAHSYEPTPQDIVSIEKSDVFIYTSESMEPWAHKIITTVGSENTKVIEAGEGLTALETEHHEDEHHDEEAHEDHDEHGEEDDDHHEDEHHDEEAHEDHDEHGEEGDDHHEDEHHDDEAVEDHDDHEDHDAHGHSHEHGEDPHIWLDPVKAEVMVENIVQGLSEAAPEYSDTFKANGQAYIEKLQELDHEFAQVFQRTESHTIVSGGHFAFGHFVKRYNLEFKTPYEGFAPDAEPTPKSIATLIETVKADHVKGIFYEELVDPKVAKIISEEAGVEMYLLHAAHNVSKEELESGVTYLEIMYNNMETLKMALGYK